MDNRILGSLLIISAIILAILVISFEYRIRSSTENSCICEDHNVCPHAQVNSIPLIVSFLILGSLTALGIFLVFFERSQVAVIKQLKKDKAQMKTDEKFNILSLGLDNDEKNVIGAVREHDGITQQTLRLRTGLHKSKLSIVLDRLESKDIITRVPSKKTKKVHLKIGF